MKDLNDGNHTPLTQFTLQDTIYDPDNFHGAVKKNEVSAKKVRLYK